MRIGTRQADDANAAAARGRRNGDDRVGCGEHASGARLAQRLAEMMTVFRNASPTLSDDAVASSATAR